MAATIAKWLVQFAVRNPGQPVQWIALNDGDSDIRFPTPELAQRAYDDVKRRQPELELRVQPIQVPV
jgi:hypothetical protein